MKLNDLLQIIAIGTKIAIDDDRLITVDTVENWLRRINSGECDGIAEVIEIEPDGYTDMNGISYLKVFIRKKEILND